MKTLLTIVFCLYINNIFSNNVDSLLTVLDKEVTNSNVYFDERQKKINLLKQNLSVATFPNDKYLIGKQLVNNYLRLDGDSAETYIKYCINLGVQENNMEWKKESELLLIMLYAIRNLQPFATSGLIKYGEIESVLPPLRTEYAKATLENYIRMTRRVPNGDEYYKEGERLWNMYSPYIPKDAWFYTYYKYSLCNLFGIESVNEVMSALSKTESDSHERAILEFTLYNVLTRNGNLDEAFVHLILSALCDIRVGNREANSLLIITKILSEHPSQTERTLKYLDLCDRNTRLYKDYFRSLQLIDIQHTIQERYEKRLDFQNKLTKAAVVVLSILLIILVYFFILLKRKQKKQNESLCKIENMNTILSKQNTEIKEMAQLLKQSNENLVNEICQRDKHFINAFYLCSTYIENIKRIKRNLIQLMKTGMIKDAIRVASSSETNDEGLQALYKKFDIAFLAIHPDFVEKFNKLIQPEKRITLKEEGTLTPELRIYALVCLGINDSTSIAEFLHYSPQTVYNYRLKMRRSACIDEKIFAETVRNLYMNVTYNK